jgi:hypothetical protein
LDTSDVIALVSAGVSTVVSGISLIVSFGANNRSSAANSLASGANVLATKANEIASTDPFASIIMQTVVEEIRLSLDEKLLFSQFHMTPHKSKDAKVEKRQELATARNKSVQNISTLLALTAVAKPLMDAKKALLAVNDSFEANDALVLDFDSAGKLIASYERHREAYLQALRKFADQVNRREGLVALQ